MRHVVRLGERRHRDERHPEAELIEVGAIRRIRTRRGEPWTDRSRIRLADRTLRTAAGLLAGRRVREVLALAGVDAVGVEGAPLPSRRRGNVIVEPAVLVVDDEDDRVVPARAVPYGVHDLRDEVLAGPNVVGRVLVGLVRRAVDGLILVERRVDE